jgi:hypothetical protein
MTGDEDEGADEAGGEDDGAEEERDEWVEVGSVKANEGPVWRAAWAPREYGTTLLVSIAGSVVNVWGESRDAIENRTHRTADRSTSLFSQKRKYSRAGAAKSQLLPERHW